MENNYLIGNKTISGDITLSKEQWKLLLSYLKCDNKGNVLEDENYFKVIEFTNSDEKITKLLLEDISFIGINALKSVFCLLDEENIEEIVYLPKFSNKSFIYLEDEQYISSIKIKGEYKIKDISDNKIILYDINNYDLILKTCYLKNNPTNGYKILYIPSFISFWNKLFKLDVKKRSKLKNN